MQSETELHSNCNAWAWREFREGRTDVMILSKTRYSKWARLARSPLWQRTLKPLGYALGYPAWFLVQTAWVLMYGQWAHVTTDRYEFVPLQPKSMHWHAPWIFKGKVQEIES